MQNIHWGSDYGLKLLIWHCGLLAHSAKIIAMYNTLHLYSTLNLTLCQDGQEGRDRQMRKTVSINYLIDHVDHADLVDHVDG